MVGHRSARYRNFGWASARLDDVLNLVPARVSALLAAVLAPIVGGSRTDALRTWTRDASATPAPTPGRSRRRSPAPWACSSVAPTSTAIASSTARPWATDPRHSTGDIDRSVRLADAVGVAALAVSVVV